MKKLFVLQLASFLTLIANAQPAENTFLQVKTANGILQGIDESGVRSFKGVPFAASPVNELRWREPQPVKNWQEYEWLINLVHGLCKGRCLAI